MGARATHCGAGPSGLGRARLPSSQRPHSQFLEALAFFSVLCNCMHLTRHLIFNKKRQEAFQSFRGAAFGPRSTPGFGLQMLTEHQPCPLLAHPAPRCWDLWGKSLFGCQVGRPPKYLTPMECDHSRHCQVADTCCAGSQGVGVQDANHCQGLGDSSQVSGFPWL